VPQFGGSEEQVSKNSVAIASSVLLAFAAARAASAQETRMVSVDGHAMRVQTAGLNHTPKSPGIVFESGAGMGLTAWSTVLPDVGQFARVVAYDRAGIGLSEADGQPPTPRHVAQRLRRLLAQMDFQPPYVLVGHSWGGPLIRMFAALYPKDVAGLVYVDSTAVRSEQQHLEYLRAIGHTAEGARREIDRSREQMESFVRSRTGPYGAEMDVILALESSHFAEFRQLPPPPPIPVAILIAGRFDPGIWTKRPCEPKACHDTWLRFRTEWLKSLAAEGQGTVTVAAASGHEIQVDDPALVISAIRRLTAAGRVSD